MHISITKILNPFPCLALLINQFSILSLNFRPSMVGLAHNVQTKFSILSLIFYQHFYTLLLYLFRNLRYQIMEEYILQRFGQYLGTCFIFFKSDFCVKPVSSSRSFLTLKNFFFLVIKGSVNTKGGQDQQISARLSAKFPPTLSV